VKFEEHDSESDQVLSIEAWQRRLNHNYGNKARHKENCNPFVAPSQIFDHQSIMSILSLPLEMFEQVVGAMSFVDLPHFIQTSKQIKVFKIPNVEQIPI
jgi:hypothetical protein